MSILTEGYLFVGVILVVTVGGFALLSAMNEIEKQEFEEQYPNPLTCEQIVGALDHQEEYKVIDVALTDSQLIQKWITTKCFEGGD